MTQLDDSSHYTTNQLLEKLSLMDHEVGGTDEDDDDAFIEAKYGSGEQQQHSSASQNGELVSTNQTHMRSVQTHSNRHQTQKRPSSTFASAGSGIDKLLHSMGFTPKKLTKDIPTSRSTECLTNDEWEVETSHNSNFYHPTPRRRPQAAINESSNDFSNEPEPMRSHSLPTDDSEDLTGFSGTDNFAQAGSSNHCGPTRRRRKPAAVAAQRRGSLQTTAHYNYQNEQFQQQQQRRRARRSIQPRSNSFELKQDAISSMQTDGTLEALSAIETLRCEEDWKAKQNFWRQLAIRASPPETSQKELIQRGTFIVMSSMTVGAGVLWAGMYLLLGEYLAACMPIIYSTVMSLVLFICLCKAKGRYDIFVECQLTLILLLPFAVHVALGGIEESGGVMLWSFLCPVGAAFFRSASESLRWFAFYMFLNVVLLVAEFWNENVSRCATMIEVPSINDENKGMEVGSFESASTSSSGVISNLYYLMNILGVKTVIFTAVFIFARELEKEYTKSEEVLSNILPTPIVKRIKRGEFPIVDHVAGVSILFADLVGFTKASAELHPNFLIGLFLRDIFHAFDELVYEHGLEKIKTIGDAYMVVGGLNHSEKSQSAKGNSRIKQHHTKEIMLVAIGMLDALKKINHKYNLDFNLRIGVHTGPVVAGVLGLKRFAYDVWGDSVNTASRMESNGVPGHVHLSSDQYNMVKGMKEFSFTCLGSIQIKGKGEMTTYLAKPL